MNKLKIGSLRTNLILICLIFQLFNRIGTLEEGINVFSFSSLWDSKNDTSSESSSESQYSEFCQIIKDFGYPCEIHSVMTKDGYKLTLFRIPDSHYYKLRKSVSDVPKKQPILLQHGLLGSSITWVINNKDQSLAYILADHGYDVWLMNSRGNCYSCEHDTLNSESKEYWDFTFEDMAKYDLPAAVDYIINVTGFPTVSYVGYSQGTMIFFISNLLYPDLADKVPIAFLLGPVANVSGIQNGFLRVLSGYGAGNMLQFLGFQRFSPSPTLFRWLIVDFCTQCETCCLSIIESIVGPHHASFNRSRMPFISSHEPGGTSTKNMIHYTQLINQKQFQSYDYGEVDNVNHYNSTKPIVFNLSKLSPKLKLYIYSGSKDTLSNPVDVASLVGQLPKESVKKWKIIKDFAHIDFVWSIAAHNVIYDDILYNLDDHLNFSQ
ncbi:carboxylic ester hydrolase [Tieghemostelium lacteum]|uniref:Lipase n=1 Tax=Tieghemostelium lacteum TaxID=361077 RepID=A0A151Z696_TIELA|nr:carboxylic ester hydrolase [Tieghemostelium lacteum]|eukprot:KYQ89483.1 carboxylic ester hydrolase [Tieghemostelium lacteum]